MEILEYRERVICAGAIIAGTGGRFDDSKRTARHS
jgi:hypothetical protein